MMINHQQIYLPSPSTKDMMINIAVDDDDNDNDDCLMTTSLTHQQRHQLKLSDVTVDV